ncbi:Protein of unknown function DUF247, plant [Dillenia turbinata]|uniref:Uncharacterized protein n=1 Tax=Dillenia turbinata TaxID=194707 RepID=A0AAN8UK35_9MAGN
MDNPDAEQSGISEHEGKISSRELLTVIVEIRELLKKSRTVAPTREHHYICRVSAPVRDLNAASYTPKVAAIGPYHRQACSKAVEDIKSHYLQLVLGEKTQEENENIVTEMSTLIKKTREYYAESTETVPNHEFLKMMLFDSCFIVEIRRFYGKEEEEMHEYIFDDDPIFIDETTRSTIRRDLVLFENQLPFFVLQRFYDLTLRPQNVPKTKSGTLSFSEMALRFVGYTISGEYCHLPRGDNYKPKHLLGLLYDSLTCSNPRVWIGKFGPCSQVKALSVFSDCGCLGILLLVLFLPCIILSICKALPFSICGPCSPPSGNEFKLISCSTSLLEKGVKFKGKTFGNQYTLFDVKFTFEEGTLEMSPLTINTNTKAVFLNLLACERYCRPSDQKYVRDYMALIDCLVDSSDDVEILRKHGIFENSSQDNEEITKLFDRPKDDFINIDPKNFVYLETFQTVNSYCDNCWTHFVVTRSKWMAKLRAKYFDSPWTLISLLAATFLLALTVVQTIYAVLSYDR